MKKYSGYDQGNEDIASQYNVVQDPSNFGYTFEPFGERGLDYAGQIADFPQEMDLYNDRVDSPDEDKEIKNIKRRQRKRLMILNKLKSMKKEDREQFLEQLRNTKDNPTLSPTSWFDNLYGWTFLGNEGLYSSPLEWYSGSIVDEPGAQTQNPFANTYQSSAVGSSSNSEKIQIRAMIFEDFRKKQ